MTNECLRNNARAPLDAQRLPSEETVPYSRTPLGLVAGRTQPPGRHAYSLYSYLRSSVSTLSSAAESSTVVVSRAVALPSGTAET